MEGQCHAGALNCQSAANAWWAAARLFSERAPPPRLLAAIETALLHCLGFHGGSGQEADGGLPSAQSITSIWWGPCCRLADVCLLSSFQAACAAPVFTGSPAPLTHILERTCWAQTHTSSPASRHASLAATPATDVAAAAHTLRRYSWGRMALGAGAYLPLPRAVRLLWAHTLGLAQAAAFDGQAAASMLW